MGHGVDGDGMTGAVAGPCDAGVITATRHQAPDPARWTLAACILGSSLAFIDGSVVNVALPTLQRELGGTPEQLSWTINAYLLPLGALILLGGGAGDHYGRRRLFLAGLAVFTLASLLCALAPSYPWLLAGRGLQGLGAALLMPNSLAILGATFTGEARGRAIGTWAATGALAGALGPLLGGWLVDAVGWRMIFLLNLPIAGAAGWLGWRHVVESRDAQGRGPLDWGGAALATVGLGLLTWALTVVAASDAPGAMPALAAGLGAACCAGFLWWEARRGSDALMPLEMFGSAAFVGLTLFTFCLYGALGGLVVALPFLLIRVEDWSAVQAGAALMPLPLLIGLGSRVMGQLTGKFGGRLPLAGGAAIVAVGFALYARVAPGGIDFWWDILPPTLVIGLGMAISVAPLTTTVMASVDADHVGAASGFNSAVARIAGLVATALLGFVLAQQANEATFVAGFRVAALLGAASAAFASAAALLLIRR